MTQHERRVAAYMNLHGKTRKQAEALVKLADLDRKPRPAAKPTKSKRRPGVVSAVNDAMSNPRPRKSTAISGRKGLSKTAYVNRPSQATEHMAPTKRLKARRKAALNAPEGYFPNPRKTSMEKIREARELIQLDVFWHDSGRDRYKGMTAAEIRRIKTATAKAYETAGVTPFLEPEPKPRKKNPVGTGIKRRKKSDIDPGGYRVESSMNGSVWRSEGIFPTKAAAVEYAHALNRRDDNKYWYRVTV